MQVKIYRGESKGMFGGTSFEYNIRIIPTSEELNLIQKYKADKEVIYQTERSILGQKWDVSFTVGDFIKGKSIKSKNLFELISLESVVKDACQGLNTGLHALSKMGMEETTEV